MTMMPSFSDLTYFLEVVATGNISRAADRLGITQPSLSAAMKRLEDSLGVLLFTRSRTGVHLTKAGKDLSLKARVLLEDWNRIRGEVSKKENSLSGEYVIGCHPAVAMYSLGLFLPKLVQNFPELEFKLIHDLSRKITERVISHEIDFGIAVNPVKHPDIVINELCTDEVTFWTANPPSKTQSLDSRNGVVVCDPELSQSQVLLGQLRKNDVGFRRQIQSASLEVIADLAAAGVGVGILPARVAGRLGSQRLKRLNEKAPKVSDKICLVYRFDTQRTAASKYIIQSIKNSMK